MSDCLVQGCVIRGQHIPDPTTPHPDTCKGGCVPRPAADGIALCGQHARRFEDAVAIRASSCTSGRSASPTPRLRP